MSSSTRAWMVAASIGAVEALKDQGFCRWNHAFRSLQQHAKNNIRSYSQTKKLSANSCYAVSDCMKSEESLRKVMYLTCWGPN